MWSVAFVRGGTGLGGPEGPRRVVARREGGARSCRAGSVVLAFRRGPAPVRGAPAPLAELQGAARRPRRAAHPMRSRDHAVLGGPAHEGWPGTPVGNVFCTV